MDRRSLLAALTALFCCAAQAQSGEQAIQLDVPPSPTFYSLIDLGVPNGYWRTSPQEINNEGWVLGTSVNSMPGSSAVSFWGGAGWSLLVPPGGSTRALDMNDQGHIVGFTPGQNGAEIPTLWNGPTGETIPLPAGFFGTDINNAGQVMGGVGSVSTGSTPAVWDGVHVTSLPTPTLPAAFNDLGQFVAYRLNDHERYVVDGLWDGGGVMSAAVRGL